MYVNNTLKIAAVVARKLWSNEGEFVAQMMGRRIATQG